MTPPMTLRRTLVVLLLLSLAVVLQASVLSVLAWRGVVPDLALLVVVAVALTHGGRVALPLAFVAGLLLDVVPPADHVAGRWALAFVVAAYLASHFRPEVRPGTGPSATATVATVAACSFVATSVFALTGLLLADPAVGVVEMLAVVGASVLLDVLVAPLVMPLLLGLLRRLDPDPLPMRG